ncbi:nuclear transport factor 2 family protein [Streptomyces sp. NRRL B-1347]|uniref:nuclear transport factor 2 family protein n=1 Tax=Streptomyces sp. NRRL B-1347 TaxID=1476877 RepID=UPI000AB45B93|nr:nuclear transport factor 2 family protein [Streptomyces sp. NRRL B-1347]
MISQLDIAELFARLAGLLDEQRYDEVHTVYAEDVVAHSPRGETRGLAEVIALLKRSHVEGERTQHVHSDVLVPLDGDRAKASANGITYFYRAGEPPYRTSGLHVDWTLLRTPAGWRVSTSRIALAWMREE